MASRLALSSSTEPPRVPASKTLVVFMRGVNVGGHRTFRPAKLVEELRHLEAVNIGAAGTFVIRRPVGVTRVRDEIVRRLPFETDLMICRAADIARLVSRGVFAGAPARPHMVRFVSILARVPRSALELPIAFPPRGPWLLKVLARDGRFVFGIYRRHMKVIGHLGKLDRLFGVPATTRSWNTIEAIVRVLGEPDRRRSARR